MKWDDVRILEALARTGSHAAAGREVGVSTSTVYRRLDTLSAELKRPLLVVGSSTLSLTPEARRLVALASSMREGLLAVHQTIHEETADVQGRLRMTTVEGLYPLLTDWLAEVVDEHPKLVVELHLQDSGPSVQRREADLALGVMAHPPETLVGRRLMSTGYAVYGTQAALDSSPRRWIVSGPPTRRDTAEVRWEERHAQPTIATASRQAYLDLLRRGVGVGLLASAVAERFPELNLVPGIEPPTFRRTAWALMHEDMRDDPRVRVAVDSLVNHFERLRKQADRREGELSQNCE